MMQLILPPHFPKEANDICLAITYIGNNAVCKVGFDVSMCSLIMQAPCCSHNANIFSFPYRGCAKAGESVLVHGASGGVSILRRRQVIRSATFCPEAAFACSSVYGHIYIKKCNSKIRIFSQIH